MLPWLLPAWNQWLNTLNNDHLSSSTLLVTDKGCGADVLVEQMAKGLLCKNGHKACGFCHSCQLFDAQSHPDYHVIKPEKVGKLITVDQIRAANKVAVESSQLGGLRVILVSLAEQLNESAANALLKTLEEPAEKCCFILVSEQSNRVLPTIRSRCRKVTVTNPVREASLIWLSEKGYPDMPGYVIKINNYSPLDALAFMQQDELGSFTSLEQSFCSFISQPVAQLLPLVNTIKSDAIKHLTWLWYCLSDSLKIHQNVNMPDYTPSSQEIADKVSYALVHKQLKALVELINQLTTQSGLNDELLVTNWLLDFIEDPCL
ncbi:DNA polymerase III subunit delta' [Vibrio sp.]|nr:DNA polymerase III subunit delta' [Vibrio sp.]